MKDRKDALADWLSENVTTYSDIRSIRLHGFVSKEIGIHGNLRIDINGADTGQEFSWSLAEAHGYAHVFYPMFHSPLGVPGSFLMIDFPNDAMDKIKSSLRDTFPRLIPLGINMSISIPEASRIRDVEEFEAAICKISAPSFDVDVKI